MSDGLEPKLGEGLILRDRGSQPCSYEVVGEESNFAYALISAGTVEFDGHYIITQSRPLDTSRPHQPQIIGIAHPEDVDTLTHSRAVRVLEGLAIQLGDEIKIQDETNYVAPEINA